MSLFCLRCVCCVCKSVGYYVSQAVQISGCPLSLLLHNYANWIQMYYILHVVMLVYACHVFYLSANIYWNIFTTKMYVSSSLSFVQLYNILKLSVCYNILQQSLIYVAIIYYEINYLTMSSYILGSVLRKSQAVYSK